MSGIFGYSDPRHQLDAAQTSRAIGQVMLHRPWYTVDQADARAFNVSIGRVGIGIFNRDQQPVWNEAHTIALCMAGELQRQPDSGLTDEQYALKLYEKDGFDFAASLNGMFSIVVLDLGRGKLVLTNDRFRIYHFYYTLQSGRLAFAAEMKGVLAIPSFQRKLDITALAQYMRFQQILGERTFFEDLHLFPQGSVMVYDIHSGEANLHPYWTWKDLPPRPDVQLNEAAEEAGRLLRKAVVSRSSDSYRVGVYLSGGLDARTLLGLVEKRPVVSVAYGAPNSRDVLIAQRIARRVGSDHHWFDMTRGDWVREQADFHIDLIEGNVPWIHLHGMNTLEEVRKLIDVGMTGWDGGMVFGHPHCIDPLQINTVDELAITNLLYYRFNQEYTWPSITEAEERTLYTQDYFKLTHGLAYDSFREEFHKYSVLPAELRGELFTLDHHTARMSGYMNHFYRSHFEIRLPYYDYDLLDYLYSLNPWTKSDRRLLREVITRETPQLATLPYDHDEYWPTTKKIPRTLQVTTTWIKKRINTHLFKMYDEPHTLYADYETYLRGDLRTWAEGILYDPRTLERGIFNPDALHSLMNRHLSGLEIWTIGKIAPIITYEMMLRRLLDEQPVVQQ